MNLSETTSVGPVPSNSEENTRSTGLSEVSTRPTKKLECLESRKEDNNQTQSEVVPESNSKKRRKMGSPRPSHHPEQGTSVTNNSESNIIINLLCLQSLVSNLHCPHCRKPTVSIREGGQDKRDGLACLLELSCSDCGHLSQERTQQPSGKNSAIENDNEMNRRIVAGAIAGGVDHSQVSRFFSLMNMPQPMSLQTWNALKSRRQSDTRHAAKTSK